MEWAGGGVGTPTAQRPGNQGTQPYMQVGLFPGPQHRSLAVSSICVRAHDARGHHRSLNGIPRCCANPFVLFPHVAACSVPGWQRADGRHLPAHMEPEYGEATRRREPTQMCGMSWPACKGCQPVPGSPSRSSTRAVSAGTAGAHTRVLRLEPASSRHHGAQVLADFRDSMLYALLCSIALRPVKEWLVGQLDASLADPRRSVGGALLGLAVLPLHALVDSWEEGRAILGKWRQAVQEEFQRRQAALRRSAAAAAAEASPASPRTPRTAAAAASAARTSALPVHTMPSLAVYGHAAVRVLKSRWVKLTGRAPASACQLWQLGHLAAVQIFKGPGERTQYWCLWCGQSYTCCISLSECCRRTSKKRRRQRQQAKRAPEGSSLLFRWLFRSVAAWLLWEWVRVSWGWGPPRGSPIAGVGAGGLACLVQLLQLCSAGQQQPCVASDGWHGWPLQNCVHTAIPLLRLPRARAGLLVHHRASGPAGVHRPAGPGARAPAAAGLQPLPGQPVFSPIKTPTASATQVGQGRGRAAGLAAWEASLQNTTGVWACLPVVAFPSCHHSATGRATQGNCTTFGLCCTPPACRPLARTTAHVVSACRPSSGQSSAPSRTPASVGAPTGRRGLPPTATTAWARALPQLGSGTAAWQCGTQPRLLLRAS